MADSDAGGVVVTTPYLADGLSYEYKQLRVFEQTGLTGEAAKMVVYQYAIVLTRSPEEDVFITAIPELPTEAAQLAGSKGIALLESRRPGWQ